MNIIRLICIIFIINVLKIILRQVDKSRHTQVSASRIKKQFMALLSKHNHFAHIFACNLSYSLFKLFRQRYYETVVKCKYIYLHILCINTPVSGGKFV